MGTDGAISGPPPSYWVPPVARICHVSVFLYILIIVSLQYNPIQSKEMTTEQRDLLLSCQFWPKLELISKLTSGFKRINFLLRTLFKFHPSAHLSQFFPLFVAGNSRKPFPLLIAALTIRWRISDTLSSVSVFRCLSQ